MQKVLVSEDKNIIPGPISINPPASNHEGTIYSLHHMCYTTQLFLAVLEL